MSRNTVPRSTSSDEVYLVKDIVVDTEILHLYAVPFMLNVNELQITNFSHYN